MDKKVLVVGDAAELTTINQKLIAALRNDENRQEVVPQFALVAEGDIHVGAELARRESERITNEQVIVTAPVTEQKRPRGHIATMMSLIAPDYLESIGRLNDQHSVEKNPELDRIALRMKAIRLLNKDGNKKPSKEQIEKTMRLIDRSYHE